MIAILFPMVPSAMSGAVSPASWETQAGRRHLRREVSGQIGLAEALDQVVTVARAKLAQVTGQLHQCAESIAKPRQTICHDVLRVIDATNLSKRGNQRVVR